MSKNILTKENFELLLQFLDRNRETAGQKYEKIRRNLIRMFAGRGCFEPENLADQTFNRVTDKIPEISENYSGEPEGYFFGVGKNLLLEWLQKQKKRPTVELNEHREIFIEPKPEPEKDYYYECLQTCLKTLPEDQRWLIIEYYKEEKTAKILHHRKLAEDLGISLNALQVKVYRIRNRLGKCIRECIGKKNM